MKKKPSTVGETQAPYAAKAVGKEAVSPKTDTVNVRHMDDATFRKSADKVFKVHNELFRKLAQ